MKKERRKEKIERKKDRNFCGTIEFNERLMVSRHAKKTRFTQSVLRVIFADEMFEQRGKNRT